MSFLVHERGTNYNAIKFICQLIFAILSENHSFFE